MFGRAPDRMNLQTAGENAVRQVRAWEGAIG